MKFTLSLLFAGLLPLSNLFAGSATWNLNPTTGDWNTAANWIPATVPNGSTDMATFDVSSISTVSVSADTEVSSIVFNPGPSAFTITVTTNSFIASLTLSGAGIVNNSAVTQNFVTTALTPRGTINFTGSASAGGGTVFTNEGKSSAGGAINFEDTSTAADAIIINEGGGGDVHHEEPGFTSFFDNATAGNSTILCQGGIDLGFGGTVAFAGNSTAGNATITCDGAIATRGLGGSIFLEEMSTAGDAVITLNGTNQSGSTGATADLTENSSMGNATFIVDGSTVAGGLIRFPSGPKGASASTGGTARLEIFGNGTLDISAHAVPGLTTGSLEGDGRVLLGANALTIGSNNLSTAFSGVISDSGLGSLIKTGNGKLTLSGANTYTGGTTINGGTLYVTNRISSSTGSGAGQVNAGKLGGTGRIAGAVTIGDGDAPRAYLTPGIAGSRPATLTIHNTLTFQADGTLHFGYKSNGTGDRVVARGVTIQSGAQLFFGPIDTGTITAGTVFMVVNNTAATQINGTFSNLPDGGTITVGSNTFQANYECGDGNDLTLIVQ